MRATIPEPDYDDPKEIYAFFGLTYYACCVLEQGLINYVVAINSKGNKKITVRNVRGLFDTFEKKTFGQLVSSISNVVQIPKSLEEKLRQSLLNRNYLAHRFWERHDEDLLNKSGRKEMIDELIDILKYIKKVDSEFDEIWISAWEVLGVSRKWVADQVEKMLENRD